MTVKEFFSYRPVSVLAISSGVRDILLGIGFLIGWDQITRTLIYQNYEELIPGVSGFGSGALMVVVGVTVILSSLVSNRDWMSSSIKLQSLVWLFSTLMYILNGHWMLAAIFGIFFTFPAGYSGYYVKHHPPIDEQLGLTLTKRSARIEKKQASS